MGTRHSVYCLLPLICLVGGGAMAQQPVDVPMDRQLVTVKLLFGMEDKEPSTWEGTYGVTEGRIIATDGWRFMADDYCTVSGFQLEVRRFYPRFFNLIHQDLVSGDYKVRTDSSEHLNMDMTAYLNRAAGENAVVHLNKMGFRMNQE